MRTTKILATSALVAAGLSLGACSSIRENRGYVIDSVLLNSVQPGIDNQRSVEMTLGRPTFTSQFGDPTWYYVSSTTGRKPFVRPRVEAHQVLAVKFGPDGDVLSADRTGIEDVVYLTPDGAETPTLGRERGFLEDLFGNIGTVGQPGLGGTGPGGPGR
ncbi:outer membrane protein assembly factor BamE [Qipengyuania sp. NPDC077563]|uniref:outer membrane protein assembly factor BamE n=1 Tax=Qipengyuania sp. NPDC077563 TaxID=3364497 RepID=UPI00384D3B84